MPDPRICKEAPYGEHAESPASREIKDLEMLKMEIVSLLNGKNIKFPVKSKYELVQVFPPDALCGCKYKGRMLTMNELVMLLSDGDFPLATAGDVAIVMTSRCPV
jgi:hypothetical protein